MDLMSPLVGMVADYPEMPEFPLKVLRLGVVGHKIWVEQLAAATILQLQVLLETEAEPLLTTTLVAVVVGTVAERVPLMQAGAEAPRTLAE
jgi:hypothetical protein